MQVKDIMSRDVVSVSPDETAAVAARMLGRGNIGSLPVCGEDRALRGVVTDRDIVLRCVAAERDPDKTPVREIMTSRVITVSPDDDAEQAARLMAEEQVRRLPVAEGGRVVGMLALGDLSVRQSCRMEAAESLTEISRGIRKK